jgi:hypothetical protein
MYEVLTAVKVTDNGTVEILELKLDKSNTAGNVRTTCGNYTSICSCSRNYLGGHLVRNKSNSFQIFPWLFTSPRVCVCVCVVVKHCYQVAVVVVVIIRRLFIALDLGQVHVGLVAGRVALGQGLLRDFSLQKLSITPTTLHIH